MRTVLERFGVPPKMLDITRHLHDDITVRVQRDDGTCSNWFDVGYGLR